MTDTSSRMDQFDAEIAEMRIKHRAQRSGAACSSRGASCSWWPASPCLRGLRRLARGAGDARASNVDVLDSNSYLDPGRRRPGGERGGRLRLPPLLDGPLPALLAPPPVLRAAAGHQGPTIRCCVEEGVGWSDGGLGFDVVAVGVGGEALGELAGVEAELGQVVAVRAELRPCGWASTYAAIAVARRRRRARRRTRGRCDAHGRRRDRAPGRRTARRRSGAPGARRGTRRCAAPTPRASPVQCSRDVARGGRRR